MKEAQDYYAKASSVWIKESASFAVRVVARDEARSRNRKRFPLIFPIFFTIAPEFALSSRLDLQPGLGGSEALELASKTGTIGHLFETSIALASIRKFSVKNG